MDYLLDGNDILEIAGEHTKIMPYPELNSYNNIQELFSDGKDCIVMLYLQEKHGKSMKGHWVALLNHPNNVVEFFDPYGLMPDSQLDFNGKEDNRELDQERGMLSQLLLDWVEGGGTAEYNETRLQEKGDDISTCGRWTSFRCRYNEVPLKKFQDLFKGLRKHKIDTDDAIFELTKDIIGK